MWELAKSIIPSLWQVPLSAGASLFAAARQRVDMLLGREDPYPGYRIPEDSRVGRFLFGREEIRPSFLRQRARENTELATNLLNKVASPSISSPLGVSAGLALTAMDVSFPIFGGGSLPVKLSKRGLARIAKVTSPRAVEELLSIHSTLPPTVRRNPELLQELARVKTQSDVLDVIHKTVGKKPSVVTSVVKRQANAPVTRDVEEQVNNLREALGLGRRERVTWREVEEAASELATDPNTLLRKIRNGQIHVSPTHLEAVRAMSERALREQKAILRAATHVREGAPVPTTLSDLAERAKRFSDARSFAARLSADDIARLSEEGFDTPVEFWYRAVGKTDADAFLRDVHLVDREEEIARLVITERELASEAGRSLNILRKTPQYLGGEEAVTYWRHRFVHDVGRLPTKAEEEALRQMVLAGDAQAAARFIQFTKHSGPADKFVALYKAGLLASLRTIGVNTFGNALMLALETVARNLAGGTEFVLHQLGILGKRSVAATGFTGLSARKMLEAAKRAWKTGEIPQEVSTRYNIPRNVRFENRYAQLYVDSVFNALTAADAAAKEAAFRTVLYEQAVVAAKNLNLHGEEVSRFVQEFVANPPDEAVTAAIDIAERITFTHENAISSAVSSVKAALRRGETKGHRAAYVASEVLIPFDRTPTNVVVAATVDYTPFGFAKALAEFFAGKTQRDILLSLGRASTGSALIGLGYFLARHGVMTGGFHGSQSRRDDEYAHALPYSINLNGTWWQVNRLAPMGVLLGIGADLNWYLHERVGSEDISITSLPTIITESTKLALGQLFDLPFVTNMNRLADLFEAYQTAKEKQAQVMLGRFISSLIPGFVRDISKFIDPTLKLQSETADAVLSQLPFLSKKVVPMLDVWGQPVEIPGGRLRAIDVLGHRKDPNDPVLQEAKALGVPIGTPSPTILRVIPLEPEEYYAFQTIQGKVLRKALSMLIQDPEYRALPYSDKVRAFMRVKREVRTLMYREVGTRVLLSGLGLSPDALTPEEVYAAIRELSKNTPDFTMLSPDQRRERLRKVLEAMARYKTGAQQ